VTEKYLILGKLTRLIPQFLSGPLRSC